MIQLLDNIYAVPVPLEANHIENRIAELEYHTNGSHFLIPLGFNFEVLGTLTATDIDFEVEPYVHNTRWTNKFGFGVTYKNYTDHDTLYLYPDLSFRSLLTSKSIMFENPLGIEPHILEYTDRDVFEFYHQRYIEAQKNLVRKIVIIKKL